MDVLNPIMANRVSPKPLAMYDSGNGVAEALMNLIMVIMKQQSQLWSEPIVSQTQTRIQIKPLVL
jgi:hypothetical protein